MRKHGFFLKEESAGWRVFITVNGKPWASVPFADYGEAIAAGACWEDLEPLPPPESAAALPLAEAA